MDQFINKNIGIIGPGRLGATLAAAIIGKNIQGISLKAISSKGRQSLKRASDLLGPEGRQVLFISDNVRCAELSDCIFICTPDDAIEDVCNRVVEAIPEKVKEKLFIHFSGAKSLKVLAAAAEAGAYTASIHPVKSFASIEASLETLPGTIYGVTYPQKQGGKVKEFIDYFIKQLDGFIIEVDDDKKSLYHAAACVASNYLVCLINYAVHIHEGIGIKKEESLKGLSSLIEGTIENIKSLGTKQALTGPIARGDIGTVEEHLYNFKRYLKDGDDLIYRIMGYETARLAFENGWIKKSTLEEFKKIL